MDLELSPELIGYAQEHHSLVWSYLYKKRLDQNEYYDVVIFGYMKAIKQYYQTKPELKEKYKFTTIAYRSMNDCVSRYWRYKRAKKRNCITLSLQDTILMYKGLCREDALGHEASYEDISMAVDFSKAAQGLTDEEKQVLYYRLQGYTANETACFCNVSRGRVYRYFRSIREKMKGWMEGVLNG